nr:PREDICTED: uncharacterized protein LOC105081767 [Camelus bactrianus]
MAFFLQCTLQSRPRLSFLTTNTCFSAWKMNSSGNNEHFEGSNSRPFFYVHTMAQQPHLGSWYQNPTCNAFSASGTGFRNGSLYFLYPVVLNEYPGFLVPQSPLPTTLNRRPIVPIFYNTAQFRQYSGYGKKMKTKHTQTEPQQAENTNKKQDMHSEGVSYDIGRVTSIPVTNIDIEMDNIPQETDGALTSVAQKRELHGKSPSSNTLYRNATQGSCASEKEQRRLEQGKGSPIIKFWKSLKETVGLYDMVYGKAMTENVKQHNEISQSSCESRGVLYNLQEGEDHIVYKDEHRAVQLEEHLDVVRSEEMLQSGSIMEMNLAEENKGYAVVSQNSPPPNAVKDRAEIQNTLNSKLYQSTGDVNKLQREGPVCASLEAGNDPSLHSGSQKLLTVWGSVPENSSGICGSPENVGEEEEVDSSSCEGCVPSPAWLAQFNKVDEGIQCGMTCWYEVQSEKSQEPSPESSRKGTGQMGSGNQDEDEDDGVERNSCEGHSPSLTRLSQSNKVDEGSQCDMSWYEAQLEKSPQQMPSRGEETSPGCKTKGSWEKTVTNRKLSADKGEKIMNDEMGEVYNENFKRCAKTKKTVRGRKLKDLSSFSNVKTAYLLKKSAALNIVLPEDSEDSELEEEVEDEMEEVECLLEVSPQGPLTSFKGRFYQDPGRIIWMPPESSVRPQLIVWPTGNKYKLKHGEYERIPVVYKVKGQDGCDSIGGRLRGKHTMAKQEGLESKRPSHKSLECNCEKSKTKVPYKATEVRGRCYKV